MSTDTSHIPGSDNPGRKGAWTLLALLASVLVLALWWIWQAIWGFGGIYTHVRYIPVPPNLINDVVDTPWTLDGIPRRWRRYEVRILLGDLVQFHREQLPKAGWEIVKEGFVTIPRGEQSYCLIAQQRGQTAYISIRDGRRPQDPEPADVSAVTISMDNPDPPYCDHSKLDE